MVRCPEPLNPINADEQRLELHGTGVRRCTDRRSEKIEETDPIWDLFCLSNVDTQGCDLSLFVLVQLVEMSVADASDVDLRRALVLLAAVVLGLPARSTHLWTHVFEPGRLEGTFVTGNLVIVGWLIKYILIK